MTGYGAASMWGDLRRVLVRPPLADDAAAWRDYGWRSAPDPLRAGEEHEALCLLLEEAGAEVVVSRHDPVERHVVFLRHRADRARPTVAAVTEAAKAVAAHAATSSAE